MTSRFRCRLFSRNGLILLRINGLYLATSPYRGHGSISAARAIFKSNLLGGRNDRLTLPALLPLCQAGTADYSFDNEIVNKIRTAVAWTTIRSRGFKGAISASRPRPTAQGQAVM